MERTLASIQKIIAINPIEGADKIELVDVLGWHVVCKKGEFKVGEKVVYCEIDSIMPEKPEFEFLRSRGFKIKTMKLNKFNVISQGIIFPLSIIDFSKCAHDFCFGEGVDVTEIIGVVKKEDEMLEKDEESKNPIIKYLMRFKIFRNLLLNNKLRNGRGFPRFISKTDETRIQNLSVVYNSSYAGTDGWSISEKIDGQSVTYFSTSRGFIFGRKFGVCSRNLHLKNECPGSWWEVAKRCNIKEKLEKVPFNVAIQGEILGSAIQNNKYKVAINQLFIFNVKNLDTNTYLTNTEIVEFCNTYDFRSVPYISFNETLPTTIDELVQYSKGKSKLRDVLREGIVVRKGNISFKVINPDFLLKHEE